MIKYKRERIFFILLINSVIFISKYSINNIDNKFFNLINYKLLF